MAEPLRAVKGMNDILPPDSARWEWIEDKVRSIMGRHAYRMIRTPIVEPTALFVRGTGETTDIVEKEMFSLQKGEPAADVSALRAAGWDGPEIVDLTGDIHDFDDTAALVAMTQCIARRESLDSNVTTSLCPRRKSSGLNSSSF